MATKEQSQMIIEYWMRILTQNSFSIDDIAQLMMEFGAEYDEFDPSTSNKDMKYKDNNLTVQLPSYTTGSGKSAYGLIDATPGRIYYWKLKLIEECRYVNIGIIKSDKLDPNQGFWRSGPRYYQRGDIDATHKYGPTLTKNDVVEMCLDLKDKGELSFIVNGKDLGKIPYDIEATSTYKLAIGYYTQGKISLQSFKIIY